MPDKMQITVTVSQDENRVTVELDPEDLINLREGDEIDQVSITLAGEQVALLQRFRERFPGTQPDGGNASLN